ncbi:MAG: hypothetical protein JWR80_8021 [Bradyrhizobium sp.]|nr:hypothetical protein [Bradyrhizobium sp.]
MAATTIDVSCPPNQWTLLATSVASVSFEWRSETGYGKWHIGQTMPDAETTAYKTIRPKAPQSLNDLSIADKVWAMPYGDAELVMEVITA